MKSQPRALQTAASALATFVCPLLPFPASPKAANRTAFEDGPPLVPASPAPVPLDPGEPLVPPEDPPPDGVPPDEAGSPLEEPSCPPPQPTARTRTNGARRDER